jgi:hypothetical protein
LCDDRLRRGESQSTPAAASEELLHGTSEWPDGRRYVGTFKDGVMHGSGTCHWPDGSRYSGEYRGGLKHGFGTFVWPAGHEYRGEYRDDKKHGIGKFTWANGTFYEGEFRDGAMAGRGSKTFADGTRYVGSFDADRPHGSGVTTYPDGTTSHDVYERGTLAESVTRIDPVEPADALPAGLTLVLRGTKGPVTGRTWHVRSRTLAIGSLRVANLRVVGDPNMSSLNTLVSYKGAVAAVAGTAATNEAFVVKDLNSVNGTAINGSYVFPPPKNNAVQHLLRPGSEITISRTRIRVDSEIHEDAPVPGAP